MSKPQITWLTGDDTCAMKLVWVDDCFFLDKGTMTGAGGFPKPPLSAKELDDLRQEEALAVVRDVPESHQRYWVLVLLNLRDHCRERSIAFGAANFEYLDQFRSTPPEENLFFLVDIENDTAERGLANLYGFRAVAPWLRRRRDQVRFFTRYTASRQQQEGTFRADRDLEVQAEHMLTPTENGEEVFRWIDRFRGPLLHSDPDIHRALSVYSYPWEGNPQAPGWNHDRLQEPNSEQARKVAEWMELPSAEVANDGNDSAKVLFLTENKPYPWESVDGFRNSRQIRAHVLESACTKLGISLELPPSVKAACLPCQPALVFLVSLRSLLVRLYPHKDHYRRPRLGCHRQDGDLVYTLYFRLRPYKDDTEFKDHHGFALGQEFHKLTAGDLEADPADSSTCTRHLLWWTHCKTRLAEAAAHHHFLDPFRKGLALPVVSLEFHRHGFTALWTARGE
jgi:hypothetical protein